MAAVAAYDEFDDEDLAPSLQNILEQKTLRWVFVGGKGGVGKTTTSCSLACQLAKVRESVLVVSTDPAHNLSDAFGQKFGPEPVKVDGLDNVYCMEVETKSDGEAGSSALASMLGGTAGAPGSDAGEEAGGIMKTIASIASSVPGIDELLSFAQLMKHVETMAFDVIVFDTAPTGHTLRLLSIPATMEKAFEAFVNLKDKFSGMMGQLGSMFGNMGGAGGMMAQLEETRATIRQVYRMSQDPERTTFVCVCIPEFLSLYETERLVQRLTELEIDTHNIVVNQILDRTDGDVSCRRCATRGEMQQQYLEQIEELYAEDFHVVKTPQLLDEVRGLPHLLRFGSMLMSPHGFGEGATDTGCNAVEGRAGGATAAGAGHAAGAGAGAGASTGGADEPPADTSVAEP